jgi:hypothetical protein
MANSEAKRRYNAKWAAENPEKVKASSEKWRANNREQKRAESAAWRAANADKTREYRERRDPDEKRAYHAAYYRANKDRLRAQSLAYARSHRSERLLSRRAHYLKSKFGLSVAEYDTMLAEQGGVCAICRAPEDGKRLAVDHCHTTGAVRGLLCQRCNRGIGHFAESAERLRAAANYVERCQDKSTPSATRPHGTSCGSPASSRLESARSARRSAGSSST